MVVATNPRPGRVWRTLAALQSAKGTAVTNFSGAAQVWGTAAVADFAREQLRPDWWMSFPKGDFENARYDVLRLRRGTLAAHATPTLMSYLLRSLFGSLSGSTFTLTGYVNAWLSLGFVEDRTLTNTGLRFVRLYDALIHDLTLEIDGTGFVDVLAHYAAEVGDSSTLAGVAGLGVTLPAAPMASTDRDVFPGRSATLWRDPAGSNVQVPFEKLSVQLNVNLDEYWDQFGQRARAIRRGPLTTTITAHGRAGDEYWQAALDANSGEKKTYRVIITEPVTGHALTLTFYNVSFSVAPNEVRDQEYQPMIARGMATQDLSDNFVGVTLT